MEIKKYLDIERCKKSYASTFEVGEPIVIQVKIDGSNASIAYDSKTNSLVAFSRRQTLNEMNTLNGFWNYVQSLDIKTFAEVLGNRYIIFGEWLVPHSVKYPEDMYKKFYMFDVWDRETEQYLTQEDSLAIFDRLKNYIPNYVHTLYNGPFISWEHTLAFLKENIYGETPCMEGIVIKRQNKLWSKSSRLPYYVKIVNEKFSEVHSSKPKTIDPEKLAAREAEQAAVAEVVTKRRIEKMLQKFEEDNLIPSDWGGESMKQISKLLPKAVYEDCRKEEPEAVITVENFGKICASLCMKYAREILDDKSKFLEA